MNQPLILRIDNADSGVLILVIITSQPIILD